MSEYAVLAAETRSIAERFASVHPYLKERWGYHFGDAKWPVFDDEERADAVRTPTVKWLVQLTDPTGLAHLVDHEVVLSGLRHAMYDDDTIESTVISTWMTTSVAERKTDVLPDWAVSRVCQSGLFGSRSATKFPYGLHTLGSSLEKTQQFAADFFPRESPKEA
ncbi:hypothetical protein ACWD7M_16460 [Streptomyces griseus]